MNTENKIEFLKNKLKQYDTEKLLYQINKRFEQFQTTSYSPLLKSPQRQYMYLVGLLMSTEDQSKMHLNQSIKMEELEECVQEITSTYLKNLMPVNNLETEENKKKITTFEAFDAYFETGILRYQEQTEFLLINLYKSFDKELFELTHLTLDDYLEFFNFIKNEVRKKLNSFKDDYQIIEIEKIQNKFGTEKTDLFLQYFSLTRKERDFKYYNSTNPFSDKPLC